MVGKWSTTELYPRPFFWVGVSLSCPASLELAVLCHNAHPLLSFPKVKGVAKSSYTVMDLFKCPFPIDGGSMCIFQFAGSTAQSRLSGFQLVNRALRYTLAVHVLLYQRILIYFKSMSFEIVSLEKIFLWAQPSPTLWWKLIQRVISSCHVTVVSRFLLECFTYPDIQTILLSIWGSIYKVVNSATAISFLSHILSLNFMWTARSLFLVTDF